MVKVGFLEGDDVPFLGVSFCEYIVLCCAQFGDVLLPNPGVPCIVWHIHCSMGVFWGGCLLLSVLVCCAGGGLTCSWMVVEEDVSALLVVFLGFIGILLAPVCVEHLWNPLLSRVRCVFTGSLLVQ